MDLPWPECPCAHDENGRGDCAVESAHELRVDVADMGAASEENSGGLVVLLWKPGRYGGTACCSSIS